MAGDWEEISFIKRSWTEVVDQPYWEEFGSYKYSSFLLLVEPTLNVLKQHKCMILQFWWLEVQNESPGTKSRYQQGCVCFEGSEENLFPSPFQPLEAALIPWLRASPSIFKMQSSNLCFHRHSHGVSSYPPVSVLQGTLWLHWAHPDIPRCLHLKSFLLITATKSLLPCTVT